MAVGWSHLTQLLEIILKYVPRDKVPSLFHELAESSAARWNGSFRETIERLRAVEHHDRVEHRRQEAGR